MMQDEVKKLYRNIINRQLCNTFYVDDVYVILMDKLKDKDKVRSSKYTLIESYYISDGYLSTKERMDWMRR